MKKSLTNRSKEINNGFNYGIVGVIIIFFSITGLLSWRPSLCMYKTVSGKPVKVDTVYIDPGGKGDTSFEQVALYLDGDWTVFYFSKYDEFKIDSTILKHKNITIWYKTYRFDSDARDLYQIEADGKMIYPFNYSESYRKIGWLILGIFLIWFGKKDSFRTRVLTKLRLLS